MNKTKLALLTLALGLAVSCSSGGDDDGGGGGVLAEASNNESPGNPQNLGTVAPGRTLSVRGNVTAFDTDQFDNFRIEASAATTVSFDLAAEGSSADLDVWLTDASGAVQQRFQSKTPGSETGEFDLASGEVALLVVTSVDASSNYLLTVTGE